jgi:hypothetical protein
MGGGLDYSLIKSRLQNHKTFQLFRKERAPQMLAFFQEAFKKGQRSDLPKSALVHELGAFLEYLALLDDSRNEDPEPKGRDPASLLDEWADEGYLRKFYIVASDEAHYDLTPETEKALEWLNELSAKRFVGTESRLLAVFNLMQDIVIGASQDAEQRIASLEAKKAAIEREIADIRAGKSQGLDSRGIKERYYELEDSARRLLSEFKQVESNFRELDRDARAKIIAAEDDKGRVLRDIFEFRDAIMASDQGKSFSAFWSFLMSTDKKNEFASLASKIVQLPEVRDLPQNLSVDLFDQHLVTAGARVHYLSRSLNEELRALLDDRNRREGRTVVRLAEEVRRLALELRDNPPQNRAFLSFEGEVDIELVMDRPLYRPQEKVEISVGLGDMGVSTSELEALFDQEAVDLDLIKERVRKALWNRPQVPLEDVLGQYPIEKGAGELLGYLSVAAEPGAALVSETERIELTIANIHTGKAYAVSFPRTIYLAELQK